MLCMWWGSDTLLGLDALIATYSLILSFSLLPLKEPVNHWLVVSRTMPGHFGLVIQLYSLLAHLISSPLLGSNVSEIEPKNKRILTVHNTGV